MSQHWKELYDAQMPLEWFLIGVLMGAVLAALIFAAIAREAGGEQ